MAVWTKTNKSYTLFGTAFPMPPPTRSRPLVLLFDIGGVCVVSPFQAILNYEVRLRIPVGWINHSIAASGPTGAWQQLEKGDIPLDAAFFAHFKQDLQDEKRWRVYSAKAAAAKRKEKVSDAAEEAAFNVPPVPEIDAEWLYWEMMRISRTPDPHMYPALKRLRIAADASNGKLVLGALSNTSIFPPGHAYHDPSTADGKQHEELRGLFDVFVSSAHVGMRKPDEDIYRFALVRLREFVRYSGGSGVEAGDVVFLDDIGTNLRTAKKVGMRTVKVQLGKADLAVRELEGITGLVLGEGGKTKL